MEKNKLRKLLVGALGNGSNMTFRFNKISSVTDFSNNFCPDFFPKEILSKTEILDEKIWTSLLRPEEGDKAAHEFIPMDSFTLILITESAELPEEVHNYFKVIKVGNPSSSSSNNAVGENVNKEDSLESLFGAKEIKKNSLPLVEHGFDGELEEIQELVLKGYHIDSQDGRGHTALSEASSQGHNHVIEWLLKEGADPNLCNDNDRSPIYRAAFQGQFSTIQFLLESGGDMNIIEKSTGDRAYDVCKDEETRQVIDAWDYSKTEALLEARAKEILKKMEGKHILLKDWFKNSKN